MKRFLRVGAISGALSLSVLTVGCGEDNEKAAEIVGKAPEGGGPKSQAEYGAQTQGKKGGGLPSNYPGMKR